ncbi:response regulator [Dyadobacter tibetensis]|uniref:response regulator n=1 Tax=Dyadobacter tibetensis TaxID=1211851 RepID=UPI000471CA4B|nr:response regulator [Dyadobacter tibetensis]
MNHRQILMADDDADDRFLVQAALEDNNIKNPLVFFEDGETLLDYLEEIDTSAFPALLLLDLNMPKRDGREVLKQLRSRKAWDHIPIIIFSTSNAPDDIYTAYELGANSYLIKPSSFEGLKNLLHAICKFWLTIHCEDD